MKNEGFSFEKQKPVYIDNPSEFDISKIENDIHNFEEAIAHKKQELTKLEIERDTLGEGDVDIKKEYEARIEKIKSRIKHLENLLQNDTKYLFEQQNDRVNTRVKMFGGDKDKPQIIQ